MLTRADVKRSLWRLAAVGFLASASGCKPTAGALVNQALIARGGVERIHALHSQRLSGHIASGSTVGGLAIEFQRPNRMRLEIDLPGVTVIRLFDGTSGWTSNGPIGHSSLEPISPTQLAQLRREADMDGPLVDSEAKGIRITLAGKGEVNGRATDQLDIVFADGTTQRYQLDAASHEPLGWEETQVIDGKEGRIASTLRATRRVEGLLFPTVIESGPLGGHPTRRITIEKIELNPPLDEARFRPPPAGGTPVH